MGPIRGIRTQSVEPFVCIYVRSQSLGPKRGVRTQCEVSEPNPLSLLYMLVTLTGAGYTGLGVRLHAKRAQVRGLGQPQAVRAKHGC